VSLRVEPVTNGRERRLLYQVPQRLYGELPAFVPMLDATFKELLDRRNNPFWKQARGREWLCWRGKELVGRIGACRDESLFERNPGLGAIGLFECVQDTEVAEVLFKTAEHFLLDAGCTRARGPLNYSIHDTAALLVEGFETPPCIDTTFNPDYYGDLWVGHGWKQAQDMIGLAGELVLGGPKRGQKFAERVRRRGITIRPLDLDRFDEEVEAGRRVFNEAWDDNWGHVPISAEIFRYKAKDMRRVFDPTLVKIAESEGKPVGFLFALPDLNVAIKKSRGKLLPLGWWRLMRAKRTTDRLRTFVLGVIPGFRKRGIEAALLIASYEHKGERYTWHEASWVLEDNAAMLNGLKIYGVKPYKRWRMYELEFTAAG